MNLHLNPLNEKHGRSPNLNRHMGDVGNITTDANGVIFHQGLYNLLTFTGPTNIIGRGVVLHTTFDDGNPLLLNNSVGNAGGRIARCVIGISNRLPPVAAPSSSALPSSTGTASTGETSTGTSSTGTASTGTASTGTTSTATGSTGSMVSSTGMTSMGSSSTGMTPATSSGPSTGVSASSRTVTVSLSVMVITLIASVVLA